MCVPDGLCGQDQGVAKSGPLCRLFSISLLVGAGTDTAVTFLPTAQSSGLHKTSTLNPLGGCSHFSPPYLLASWSKPHWSLSCPLGPAPLLTQDSSPQGQKEVSYNPQTHPI